MRIAARCWSPWKLLLVIGALVCVINGESGGAGRQGDDRLEIESGFADVNGTRLYYEVAGSGFPLILIHGSLLDGRSWDDQFGPFARRFRVVRYDARGWGRSALPPRQTYSHHDDLRALMDSLSVERAHILGLSMGGAIAIDFALTYPQRIGALIPVSSGPGGFQAPPPEEPTEKPKRVVDVYRESGLEAAKRHVFQFFKPGVRNLSLLRRMLDDYSGWHLIDEDPGVGPQSPAAQRLDEIGAPALVILGEQDHRNLHLSTDFLKKGVTGARKVVVPGVGHLLNMQQPEQFNAIVLEYLETLPQP